MQRIDWKRQITLALLSAVIYFLLDFPVQATGFLSFGPCIGIKNFLPATLGLQFGPAGVLGGWVGCIAAALIFQTSAAEVILELLTIAIVGMGMWIVWHLGSTTHRIHFKRAINYWKYLGLLLGLSAICGGMSFLLVEGGLFLSTLIAYTALGLLVGIPVNIMANGLFCFEPVLPPMYQLSYSVTGTIDSDPDSIARLNEDLEMFAFSKKIPMRRVFEMQNCVEELSIRILNHAPDAKILVRMNYDDTISARLTYDGVHYNPLYMDKDEDELDLISLKLIKHRALRASYRFHSHRNHIHVVI